MLFVGKAKHTVNKDGRVSIPAKMRDVIKQKYDPKDLYLILMPRKHINLYPGEGFEAFVESMKNPQGASLDEMLERERLCAFAEPCKLDGSGRIVIPSEMREAAGIVADQEVLVLGTMSHIEIWDPERWEWSRENVPSGSEGFRTWSVQARTTSGT